MIRWCAYCYKYLGEIPPLDSLNLTHGICVSCKTNFSQLMDDPGGRLSNLSALSKDIWAAGRAGETSKIDELLIRSDDLGVQRQDMIIGLLCPMLVEVGHLWEIHQMSVREEHQFSHFSDQILDAVRKNLVTTSEKVTAPTGHTDWLLFAIDGNYHTFGLRVVQLLLEVKGIQPQMIIPGLPNEEILEHIAELKPRFVGFSIAMPDQEEPLNKLLTGCTSLEPRPQIFVGGRAITSGLIQASPAHKVIFIKNAMELNGWIEFAKSNS